MKIDSKIDAKNDLFFFNVFYDFGWFGGVFWRSKWNQKSSRNFDWKRIPKNGQVLREGGSLGGVPQTYN